MSRFIVVGIFVFFLTLFSLESFATAKATDVDSDPLPPGAVARIGTTRLRHSAEVSSLAFSQDGKRISSATMWFDTAVWDARTGKSLAFRGSRHEKGLFRAAVSPDGTLFAGRLATGELGVQRASDGEIVQRFSIKQVDWEENLVISRDNHWLASADQDGNTCIWDLKAGKQLHEFKTKAREIFDEPCHAFTPDGNIFIQARAGSTTLWDVQTGKEIRHIDAKKKNEWRGLLIGDEWPGGVAVSPDGEILAVRIAYGRVELWEVKTGRLLRQTSNHGATVGPVFSPDGKYVVTGVKEGGICFWNVETGELAFTLTAPIEEYPTSLAFSPDGKTVASGGADHAIHLWDLASRKQVPLVASRLRAIPTARFLSDGKTLLVHCDSDLLDIHGYIDKHLSFWDLQGNFVRQTELAFEGAHAFALSSDARTVAYGHGPHFSIYPDIPTNRYLRSSIRVCDVASGKQLAKADEMPCQIVSLTFSPDDRFLLVNAFNAGENADDYHRIDALQVWMRKSPASLEKTADLPTRYFLSGYCVSADSRWVVVTGKSGYRFHDCETGKQVQSYPDITGSAVALSHNGQILVSRDDSDGRTGKEVLVWGKATGKSICKLECQPNQTDWAPLVVSPDGKIVAGCLDREVIALWDAFTGKQLGLLKGHRGEISSLCFSGDGRFLVSASADTTILVWDWKTKLPEASDNAKPRS